MVVMYKNEPYKSIRTLSESVGIPSTTITSRLARGMTVEQAVELGSGVLEVFGNEFRTVKELTDFYGINYAIFLANLSKDSNCENVVNYMLSKEPIEFEGKEYPTISDLCNEYGISSSIVAQRIHYGWSLKDSITKPLQNPKRVNSYSFRGVDYPSIRDMSQTYGVQDMLVFHHASLLNITPVQSFELIVRFLERYSGARPKLLSTIPSVIYNGMWYSRFIDFYKDIGTDSTIVVRFMTKYKIDNHFIALQKMQEHTIVRWFDSQTGEQTSLLTLKNKYKTNQIEKLGYGIKKEVKVYPNLSFNPTGYCALPLSDFKTMTKGIRC
ncbi:hypothetical protein [Bacillus toyonensis]|uniref:hypothetical protein n=1 Tax=Bacillus toyonensis TaxID=155322 RepID=UPI000BF92B9E|nr:hypothetical protein [Bacillus toyonensis]PGF05325.1 hypothetical protein COM61_02630 [Bacillus toyonensis]